MDRAQRITAREGSSDDIEAYAHLDIVFMADGTKVVRVWDASVYPAHDLYVGGNWKVGNPFQEGIHWTADGPPSEQPAFLAFGLDGNQPGPTPFDAYGAWRYKKNFDGNLAHGNHPVMEWEVDGANITAETVKKALSDPLFPSTL